MSPCFLLGFLYSSSQLKQFKALFSGEENIQHFDGVRGDRRKPSHLQLHYGAQGGIRNPQGDRANRRGRGGRRLGWCVAAESQCGLAVVGRIWGCARSRRRIGNYDASFGCRFKYAQKQAASRCYMGVLVSNPNSNGEIISDTNELQEL